MTAKNLGFNLWEISVPGQLLKIHVDAETEEEALAKGAKGEASKAVVVPLVPQADKSKPAPSE